MNIDLEALQVLAAILVLGVHIGFMLRSLVCKVPAYDRFRHPRRPAGPPPQKNGSGRIPPSSK